MSIENISLDSNFVRSQFPAFSNPMSAKWAFFENAGGSYIPQNVLDRLNDFMIKTKVQPYADFESSKIAGNLMDDGIKLFADIFPKIDKEESLLFDKLKIEKSNFSNSLKLLLGKKITNM